MNNKILTATVDVLDLDDLITEYSIDYMIIDPAAGRVNIIDVMDYSGFEVTNLKLLNRINQAVSDKVINDYEASRQSFLQDRDW
jgi:hypothetical protein